ncbi:MAG: hypothetical protein PHV30_09185 [Candidatus Margulisbacteria bacterium]|nr:hypothetical protein [Candidatus Margulisiibacteriota bacterium]
MLRHEEGDYSFWELRLKGTRTLFVYFNLIRYLQEKRNIHVQPSMVLKDTNFMPLECTLTIDDYVNALQEFIDASKTLYAKLVKSYWGAELEDIGIKVVQLEIAHEVFPCSVDDIASRLDVQGVNFRKYNTQSGTLYLQGGTGLDVRLPNGLNCEIYAEDCFDTSYINKVDSGYSDEKMQIKFYQKSFGLVRIEFTISWDSIQYVLDIDSYGRAGQHCVIEWVHKQLRDRDYFRMVNRFDVNLEDIVKRIAMATGISEETIYSLRNTDIFESSRETHNLRRSLMKKGLLDFVEDDIGVRKRGIYKVAPWIKSTLNLYKPKGTELFLPGILEKL